MHVYNRVAAETRKVKGDNGHCGKKNRGENNKITNDLRESMGKTEGGFN